MYLFEKAHELLSIWEQYKTLHYSQLTEFGRAVNIEIEKDALTSLAKQLREALINDNEQDLRYLVKVFGDHLELVKDQLTLEILRSGIAERRDGHIS